MDNLATDDGEHRADQTTLTEHFVRHGNTLTYITITEDPVYLTEPLVKSTNMLHNPRPLTPAQLLYPCQSVVEIADQPRGAVPHYLPGKNPYLREFGRDLGLPEIATRGGAATMYPEFASRLSSDSR